MLEGLEIKEVAISECLQQIDLRFEADFWIQKNDSQAKTIKGSEIIDFVQYGTSKELIDEKAGYPILRLNEFNSRFIGVPSKYCKLISQDDFENLKLQKNDVLICRTNGNPNLVGKSALVAEDVEYAYASYLFKIRPKTELINSATLVAFLSSKYGRKEINKYSMTSNQTNFSPAKFREIDIPLFSKQLNNEVEKKYYSAFEKLKYSEIIYRQAEELLLETIGLKDFNPNDKGTNIKSFKESFLATGRLDAEYYQTKYEEIENTFDKFERIALSNLVLYPISSGITPKAGGDDYTDAENGVPFIRAVDLVNGEVSTNNLNHIKSNVHNGILKRTQLKKGDVLFSIAGTVGRCAIFQHDFEANINQAVSILRFEETKVSRLYLIAFFNSFIGKEFVSKYARQGLQTNLNLEEIGALKIPIIDYKIQEQISALISESFTLRRESERLLEEAKGMVEKEVDMTN